MDTYFGNALTLFVKHKRGWLVPFNVLSISRTLNMTRQNMDGQCVIGHDLRGNWTWHPTWHWSRDGLEFSQYLISRESASLVSSRTLRTVKWNYHIVSFSENTITKSSNLRIILFLLSRHGSYKFGFPLDQNMFLKWFSY